MGLAAEGPEQGESADVNSGRGWPRWPERALPDSRCASEQLWRQCGVVGISQDLACLPLSVCRQSRQRVTSLSAFPWDCGEKHQLLWGPHGDTQDTGLAPACEPVSSFQSGGEAPTNG